jgi:DmsE family decaheme c-type cytochrome
MKVNRLYLPLGAVLWLGVFVVRGIALTPAGPGAPLEALAAEATRQAAVQQATPATRPAAPGASGSRTIRKPVDWPALNPGFAGATFVNDPATCQVCHEDATAPYEHTVHAAALRFADGVTVSDCETCHGPRSLHVENPTAELAHERLEPAAQSAVCLQCHDGGSRIGFKAGPHHTSDVSCTSCHIVMEKRSDRALLATASSTQLCYTCHAEVRAEVMKTSHHPVREGRLDCASCHNVHGATEALLVRNTVNETCYSCHMEKRGPFLWEHAPVREDCSSCHTPHGSNQRFLLSQRDPFLCMTCHSYGGHINLPRYNRTSNPYGNGCTNCHITTHGSNHPSGAKLTR